eukprot:SAG11_NODE_9466_length_908_cov_350.725587_1_plen_302_part_11
MPIKERSSFKKMLASYTIANTKNIQAYAGIELINRFRSILESMLKLHNGIKFYFDLNCLMVKYLDGEILTQDTRWVSSRLQQANNIDELLAKITSSISLVKQKIPELEARNGSMWIFKKVISIDLHVGRYKPLKGSSYVELPKELQQKKAIVNVKNTDNECFKWAILSALYPQQKHANRVNKYKKINHNLTFTQLPMPISDITKFENANDISINLYGYDKNPYLLQKSDFNKSKNINLLLYEGHYSWIKNFSRFCGREKTHNGKCKTHYCHHCLQGYISQSKLDEHHKLGCASVTTCKPIMP